MTMGEQASNPYGGDLVAATRAAALATAVGIENRAPGADPQQLGGMAAAVLDLALAARVLSGDLCPPPPTNTPVVIDLKTTHGDDVDRLAEAVSQRIAAKVGEAARLAVAIRA
jgi:hypothetical protein